MSNPHRRRATPWRWFLLPALTLALSAAVITGCGQDDDASTTTTSTAPTSEPTSTEPTSTTQLTSTTASATSTTAPTAPTAPTADETTVEVYFSVGDGSDCGEVGAFNRTVSGGADGVTVEAALTELVAGPTADEEGAGASSFFSPATADALRLVTLHDGLLLVDLQPLQTLIPNASTSCGSAALRAQLDTTVFQFPEVERVRYQIEGSCDTFHHWLQTECHDVGPGGQVIEVSVADRATGSGCSAAGADALPDGRWFGYVDTASPTSISFDLACWFTGQAAIDATTEDGAESPPPNDFHIRNDNPQHRTVAVGPDTTVDWLPTPGDPATAEATSYETWVAERADRSYQPGVWIVVAGGQISAITEQYVP